MKKLALLTLVIFSCWALRAQDSTPQKLDSAPQKNEPKGLSAKTKPAVGKAIDRGIHFLRSDPSWPDWVKWMEENISKLADTSNSVILEHYIS